MADSGLGSAAFSTLAVGLETLSGGIGDLLAVAGDRSVMLGVADR